MKIGLCEKDLRGSIHETLGWAAGQGLAGVQIWKPRLDREGLDAPTFQSMAAGLGLEITAVGGGPNLVDPAAAADSIERFKAFLDLSVALGPALVTAESKAKPGGLDDDRAWASTIETVRRICDHAESVGAVLAIEPAGPCFIRDCERFVRLRQAVGSPALKVNYDPANIVWAGRSVVDGVRLVGPDIVHTHAKDIGRVVAGAADTADEQYMDVPAGEGLVGYEAYLTALREVGYDGWLTIEMHAGPAPRLDDIARAKDNLERLLG